MDCKITENFLREQNRMCIKYRSYPNACRGCPLSCWNNKSPKGDLITCYDILSKNPQTAIEIVQKWSNAFPQKTILTDFLEKYPNAPLNNGYPSTCPYYLGYMTDHRTDYCPYSNQDCKKCWDMPVIKESEE